MSNRNLQKANATLVHYPRFKELHEDIRLCREVSLIAGEPQCMALEGVTGVGKSTLVKTYAQAFPRYETDSGTKIPVFYIETPSPVTVKGMAAALLEQLGDPGAHRGPLWSMNSRLIHFIKACLVQLVILDDFHHLIDRERNRILEQVSDWLKVLIKETCIPFLVVGIEGKVERILKANSQLSRLFAVRETMCPFEWNVDNPDTLKEFASFISVSEQGVGMSLTEKISRAELLYRLYYATDGIVGNVMNLLRFGVGLAQQSDSQVLTLDILAAAFDKRLAKHVKKTNPFTVLPDQHFTPPLHAPLGHDDPNSTNNRSRRRKKRELKASDVLRTA